MNHLPHIHTVSRVDNTCTVGWTNYILKADLIGLQTIKEKLPKNHIVQAFYIPWDNGGMPWDNWGLIERFLTVNPNGTYHFYIDFPIGDRELFLEIINKENI